MKCKHCEEEIFSYHVGEFCLNSGDGKHEPAEPATHYKPYVTELVKDHGPRIDTVPFPPVSAAKTTFERILDNAAEALKEMPQHLRRPEMREAPTQATENSSFIRQASPAESMDMDKAAAPAVEPQKLCSSTFRALHCERTPDHKGLHLNGKIQWAQYPVPEAGSTRPEMPPVEKRMICKACCTEVCSHGKCPNCHIRCKDCMEGELRAASVQQESSRCEKCGTPKVMDVDASIGAVEICPNCAYGMAAPRPQGREPETPKQEGQLTHSRNCPERFRSDDDCTCGLQFRIHLQTEQTMSAAWRKRAEEAEASLAQARTQPAPRQKVIDAAQEMYEMVADASITDLKMAYENYLQQFFTALPEAQPTNKEEPK